MVLGMAEIVLTASLFMNVVAGVAPDNAVFLFIPWIVRQPTLSTILLFQTITLIL